MKNRLIQSLRALRGTSFVFWLALVLAIIALPAAWRWLLDENGDAALSGASGGPAIQAQDVKRIIVSDNGQRVAEFAAGRIELSADLNFTTAFDVKRGIIYRNGKPFLNLRASRVKVNQQTRDWDADGSLRASGPHAFRISADFAQWIHKDGELHCPGVVQATFRGARINSFGVIYNAAQSTLSCPQPVEVLSPVATLRGQNAVAHFKDSRIEFKNGVDITIRTSALKAR